MRSTSPRAWRLLRSVVHPRYFQPSIGWCLRQHKLTEYSMQRAPCLVGCRARGSRVCQGEGQAATSRPGSLQENILAGHALFQEPWKPAKSPGLTETPRLFQHLKLTWKLTFTSLGTQTNGGSPPCGKPPREPRQRTQGGPSNRQKEQCLGQRVASQSSGSSNQ